MKLPAVHLRTGRLRHEEAPRRHSTGFQDCYLVQGQLKWLSSGHFDVAVRWHCMASPPCVLTLQERAPNYLHRDHITSRYLHGKRYGLLKEKKRTATK